MTCAAVGPVMGVVVTKSPYGHEPTTLRNTPRTSASRPPKPPLVEEGALRLSRNPVRRTASGHRAS